MTSTWRARSPPLLGEGFFKSIIWALCGIATFFLLSRVAVRMSTKGRLRMNDYFLVVALPALYVATGLLHSSLTVLYLDDKVSRSSVDQSAPSPGTASRLTGAFELLWLSIFCVKFSFLGQFKFHKPPYAYVSERLTRYYWFCIGTCATVALFAIAQPLIICPALDRCQYFGTSNTRYLEIALTAVDILTDCLVISIPILLVHMANLTRFDTVINATFKSLPIFTIAVAALRLALQDDETSRGIRYITVAFLLVVQATVSLVMASISSYRVLVINHVLERRRQRIAIDRSPRVRSPWTRSRKQKDHPGSPFGISEQALHLSLSETLATSANTTPESDMDCPKPSAVPAALCR